MKNSFIVLGLLLGALSFGTIHAADKGDQKVSQDVHQLRKDYQKKVDKDLKGIEAKIHHLKHQVSKTDAKLDADVQAQLKKLDAQKADADKKVSALKKSTDTAWKDFQKGVDEAVADLKRSVDEAAEQFKAKGKKS